MTGCFMSISVFPLRWKVGVWRYAGVACVQLGPIALIVGRDD